MAKSNKKNINQLSDIFTENELRDLAYKKFIALVKENKATEALDIIKKIGVAHNNQRSTPLIVGVHNLMGKSQIDFVKKLLKDNANPNVSIEFTESPDNDSGHRIYNITDKPGKSKKLALSSLSAAIESESDTSFDVFKLLVENGADIDVKIDGESLLKKAIDSYFGHKDNNVLIAQYLFNKMSKNKSFNSNHLFNLNSDKLKEELKSNKKNLYLSIIDKLDLTQKAKNSEAHNFTFILLKTLNDTEFKAFFKKHNLDINSVDINGNTLMHSLFSQSHWGAPSLDQFVNENSGRLQTLLDLGANLNITNKEDNTPLMCLINLKISTGNEENLTDKTKKLILNLIDKSDITPINKKGKDALLLAKNNFYDQNYPSFFNAIEKKAQASVVKEAKPKKPKA